MKNQIRKAFAEIEFSMIQNMSEVNKFLFYDFYFIDLQTGKIEESNISFLPTSGMKVLMDHKKVKHESVFKVERVVLNQSSFTGYAFGEFYTLNSD